MALTPAEQAELDALELEQLEAENAASASVDVPAEGNASVSSTVPEVPRPDSGIMASMDPFARTGAYMASPQGKEAMATTAQTVKNLGLEGGGVTLGQLAGAPLAEFGGVSAGGAIGGFLGNTAAQLTTPGKKFKLGEALAASAAGAVPGASLAKAGAKTVAQQAAKYAAANTAATFIQKGVDEKRLPSVEEASLSGGVGLLAAPIAKYLDKGVRAGASADLSTSGSLKRETLRLGRELGLVVPPAAVKQSPVNEILTRAPGKQAMAQESIIRNQVATNKAIQGEIYGTDYVAKNAPFSPIALNTAKIPHNIVYDEVSKMTEAAGPLLATYKNATAEAKRLFSAYRESIASGARNTALRDEAQAQDTIAEEMRNALNKEAAKIKGGDNLMRRFDESRKKLAQISLAERAVNPGSGDIDPAVIGNALDNGERVTGVFSKIGRFENAFGKYLKDAANASPPGGDFLRWMGRIGGGGLGYQFGGLAGAVAVPAAMEATEMGSRKLLLSPFYQNRFAQPYYGPTTEDISTGMVRLGTMKAGRQN